MKWLSKIAVRAGVDGLLHVIVSVLIVLIVQICSPWWAAVLVAIVVGLVKEFVWDRWLKKGTFEVKDLLCDVIGILIGCLAFL